MNISVNTYKPFQKNNSVSFGKNKNKNNNDKNPVSRNGEAATLAKATFLGGLAVGARLFWEIAEDGDFLVETIAEKSQKIAKKNIKANTSAKKLLYTGGAFVAISAALISGFALLYTAFKAPKIAYDSKVNSYAKGKEMDTFIKNKNIEKNLFERIKEEGTNADDEKRKELQSSFAQLSVATAKAPVFTQQKKSKN